MHIKRAINLTSERNLPVFVVHVIVQCFGHQHRYHRSDRFSLAVEVVHGDLFQLLVVGGTVDFLRTTQRKKKKRFFNLLAIEVSAAAETTLLNI